MYGFQGQFPVLNVDFYGIAVADGAVEDGTGHAIFDLFLDDALEGTRTVLWVVAQVGEKFRGHVAQVQGDVTLFQARAQAIELYLHDALHLIAGDLVEDDDFIDAVDELGSEAFLAQALTHNALDIFFLHTVKFVQPGRADVTGHDDDGVLEVNRAALPIGQAAIVEKLQ